MPKQVKAMSDGVLNPQITISINLTQIILMRSQSYESTEVDRRTWLHVLSGSLWSTINDTHQLVEM